MISTAAANMHWQAAYFFDAERFVFLSVMLAAVAIAVTERSVRFC